LFEIWKSVWIFEFEREKKEAIMLIYTTRHCLDLEGSETYSVNHFIFFQILLLSFLIFSIFFIFHINE
jgi:hypothetical protein